MSNVMVYFLDHISDCHNHDPSQTVYSVIHPLVKSAVFGRKR